MNSSEGEIDYNDNRIIGNMFDPPIHGKFHFRKIDPCSLTSKQIESYNLQKLSSVLADYGFTTIPLRDDWNGADFLASHLNGQILSIQLKGRPTFDKKYRGKDLWIAFPDHSKNSWYVYPHDQCLILTLRLGKLSDSESWNKNGNYHFPTIPAWLDNIIKVYKIRISNSTS
jgi:hypothetical protein